ncbi:hypothetical protein NsoK4_00485 [Nitrosopumilus sp. K4]|uniref:hypothetical protein n=1 Tax=Nitrosopumilus sp. K4 TaxID=2795383 RepID=UPI001BAD2DAB|nr:hypothetical protein [Nitrosopumilus sp. K4]QUC64801.1 hypothetical protein NsoK4_00485 [Nitrosopumilus sp. K4]
MNQQKMGKQQMLSKFSLLGISILFVLVISGFSSNQVYAAHVIPVITDFGSTGSISTEIEIGDPAGIFVSCDIPNTVAGLDARLQILRDSPRSVFATQTFDITTGPSTISHTFDISDTSKFSIQRYLVGCVWQDADVPGGDPSHNQSEGFFFNIVAAASPDTTPPIITAARALGSEANANGWNNSTVTVTYTCTDADSGVDVTASDLSDDVISTEGASQSATGICVDNAGNSASATINDINIDLTAPIITAARALGSEANANGWNNSTVTVTYTTSDALSGIDAAASDDGDDILSGEGASQSATGSVTDLAGNSASATINDINIDLTAPIITAARALGSEANANGWNNSTVTVTYTTSDALSGIDAAASDDGDDILSGEGASQSATGSVTDLAGNSASATINDINIDLTAPIITAARALGSEANANGWNNSTVTVTYTTSDALSGIDAAASDDGDDILSGEGASQSATGSVTDLAGNSASATINDINIDLTAPVVLTAPSTQRTEAITQDAALTPVDYTDYAVSDALSGVASSSCTDDDANSTVSTTDGSFSKGITNVTCNATDLAGNTNSDTDFTISIAEVTITEICVTGVSTENTETCSAVSPDGVGTTNVDALWGSPDLVTIRGTIFGYQTPTDVTALTADWGTNDPGSDTLDTATILALAGNEDDGARFEFTHNYAGPGVATGEYLLPEPITVTMTGSTFTSNTNAQVSVQKHTTELATTNDANTKWDHDFGASSQLNDIDAAVGVDGKTIHYSGLGVAGERDALQDKTTTLGGNTGVITLQAGKAVDAGLQDIVSEFDEDQFYLGSSNTTQITLDPHTTTTVTTVTEDSVLWDHVFHATTVITDTDAVLAGTVNSDTGSELGLKTFTYSGLGVAGEDVQSHSTTTAIITGTATTGEVALQAGEAADADGITAQNVIATFAPTAAYLGSQDQTDSIILDKHSTTTSLDPLIDLVGGTSYTPSGFVSDNDRVLKDDPTILVALGNPDNFVNFDTGSFAGKTVKLQGTGLDEETGGLELSVTLGGVTVTDPNGSFDVTPYGIKILKLTQNGNLTIPDGAIGVTLDIRNLKLNDQAIFTVTPNVGEPFDVIVDGVDQEIPPELMPLTPDYATQLISQSSGISNIVLKEFTIEDGDTFIEISAIRLSDSAGDPPIFFDFELTNVPDEQLVFKNGKVTFVSGSFSNITITANEESEDLTVKAVFEETPEYLPSESPDRLFDTIFQSWGVGGINTSIAPDAGTGFTAASCGADTDTDSLCDVWEFNGGISYKLGGGVNDQWDFPTTYLLPIAETSPIAGPQILKKDVYIELDYMKGHKPSDLSMRDIILAFSRSPAVTMPGETATGINFHIQLDEEIEHVSDLNVWTDNDDDATNDFNSIKSRYFGTAGEHPVLTGHTITVPSTGTNTYEVTWDGMTLTSPTDTTLVNTRGLITAQAKITFDTDTPGIVLQTPTREGSPDGSKLNIGAGRFFQKDVTPDFSDPTGKTFVFTVKAPYTAVNLLGADAGFDVGFLKLPFTTNGATITGFDSYKSSPTISTELLNAKAQAFHYGIIAHSIGDCGPSGVAELNGNDFIISLGCNFSVAEEGLPTTDENGNKNTVGSRWEFAGTFLHEIGHNFGLAHGGPTIDIKSGTNEPIVDSSINCKPNYHSVMSYARQTPLYLGTPFPVTYSSGLLPDMDEKLGLDEDIGLLTAGTTSTIVWGGSDLAVRKASTYTESDPVVKVDWNGDGTTSGIVLDADPNNLNISGCDASPNQKYSDHDDWNNLNFNFRGSGGSQFDGFKSDPRKTAEVTEKLIEEMEVNLDFYSGLFSPVSRDGSSSFKVGSTIPLKFKLFSCNPEDLQCWDRDGLAGEAEPDPGIESEILVQYNDDMDDPLLGKKIFARVFKFSGDVVSTSGELLNSEESGDTGFFRFDPVAKQFIFNWDTKTLLDPSVKGKDKKSNVEETAGGYAIRIIVLEDGIETLLLDREIDVIVPQFDTNGEIDDESLTPATVLLTLVP